MRILITEYRGWEIFFDTEKEDFYTVSNEYDKQNTKKSFSSTKKFIDDYIKENLQFKPFFVERVQDEFFGNATLKIIGIRKDGFFMCENSKGEKAQLSKYSEKDYILVNSENEQYFEARKELRNKIQALRDEMNKVGESIIKVYISEMREHYLGK